MTAATRKSSAGMHIRSVSLRREGEYYGSYSTDVTKPFRATIEVQGTHGKVELLLSADLSQRIVEIVAEEIANAGRATAEAMTADALSVAALPAPAVA